ncbi:MAG: putative DNA binding domain-containing protein [Bacillota bacterium]|nr:putative DNA binding domain-containing protein [Bacillota bacterium]
MNLGNENETQEFKLSLAQLDKGLKSLAAMLNRNGTGTVYFGVDDNGEVKGLTVGKKTLLDIRNRVCDLIEPRIICKIDEMTDERGNSFIKVSAKGYDMPYSFDGRYFIRNVSADERISNEILRKMLASGDADLIRQISSERQDLSFSGLCTMLLQNDIHAADTARFHFNYGLMNKDEKFNLMAYLLSDQNEIMIKVVRFAGLNKSVMSERTEYGAQCLLISVNQVLQYFKAINTTKVDLSEGQRKETHLFLYEAFREAWINACLHNSWAEKVPPAVHVFDNRIEIISYGGLPYGLSEEGFFHGTSVPVNKGLLTVFMATHFAEQTGHGVPIIVSSYGRKAFSFDDGMVKVTLAFAFEPDIIAARKHKEKLLEKLTSNQTAVLMFLKDNPQSTLQEAADAVSLSVPGVKKIVAKLQKLELLTRVGSKKDGDWLMK